MHATTYRATPRQGLCHRCRQGMQQWPRLVMTIRYIAWLRLGRNMQTPCKHTLTKSALCDTLSLQHGECSINQNAAQWHPDTHRRACMVPGSGMVACRRPIWQGRRGS